jgi:ammonium transporter, Amt family
MASNTTAPPPTVPSCIDTGDTTWVLISTVLVLGMMPGLAFFEAGLLRNKNTLSIITQTIGGIVTLSVMWYLLLPAEKFE